MERSMSAIFPLVVRALLGIQLVVASGVLGSQESNGTAPSVATLAGCKTSCGDLTFNYPFGIGPRCSRGTDFELTCNESTQPPTLLLRDGITQVAYNIVTVDTGYIYSERDISINILSTIPVSYNVNVYSMPWSSPGASFALSDLLLNVTGCNFDIYFTDLDANITSLLCSLTCPTSGITEMEARQNCNGTGCCTILSETTIRAFNLKFVRGRESIRQGDYNQSSLWDYLNVATVYADLSWNIVDKPSCATAKENKTKYACVGENTRCLNAEWSLDFGYYCKCIPGYIGNPYLLDGCSTDKGNNDNMTTLPCFTQQHSFFYQYST